MPYLLLMVHNDDGAGFGWLDILTPVGKGGTGAGGRQRVRQRHLV
jgi:hypothetical protein